MKNKMVKVLKDDPFKIIPLAEIFITKERTGITLGCPSLPQLQCTGELIYGDS